MTDAEVAISSGARLRTHIQRGLLWKVGNGDARIQVGVKELVCGIRASELLTYAQLCRVTLGDTVARRCIGIDRENLEWSRAQKAGIDHLQLKRIARFAARRQVGQEPQQDKLVCMRCAVTARAIEELGCRAIGLECFDRDVDACPAPPQTIRLVVAGLLASRGGSGCSRECPVCRAAQSRHECWKGALPGCFRSYRGIAQFRNVIPFLDVCSDAQHGIVDQLDHVGRQ